MKIHLVDGTYELFRAHFGAPPKKTPDGLTCTCSAGASGGHLPQIRKFM